MYLALIKPRGIDGKRQINIIFVVSRDKQGEQECQLVVGNFGREKKRDKLRVRETQQYSSSDTLLD